MASPSLNEENPEAEQLTLSDYSVRNVRFPSFAHHYGAEEISLSTGGQLKRYLKKQCSTLTLLCCLNGILGKIPLLRCLVNYDIRKNLFGDIMAGITVAIMHIPQGMAYGVLTTLPPVHGLYVSFFPVLIYMIFGTCPHLSIGTFAIISIMTAQAIENIIPPGIISNTTIVGTSLLEQGTTSMIITDKVQIATTLALLVGLIEIILSFLRLGFLTVYLTEPFISGFTSGAAVHVVTSQIPLIFGVRGPSGINGAFKLPIFYWKFASSLLKNINLISTGIGLFSILVLFIMKDLNERFKSTIRIVLPTELFIVIIATIVSHFGRLHQLHKVIVVGDIKKGLPYPTMPSIEHVNQLIVPAITIAAVSLSISISMAKMFSRKHGYKVSSNQELLAYGISNAVSSFFQCYPNAASLSRSVVQEGSGGKSMLIGGFSSLLLGIVLIALTPLFYSLPMACLAAIIIVNLKGLFLQMRDFMFYFRISLLEFILWSMTFGSVVLFDVDVGLYVGICTSFIINTIRTQKPRFVTLGQIEETGIFKNVLYFPAATQYPKIKILRFDESLYACNAPFFKRKFYELIGFKIDEKPLISCAGSDKKQKGSDEMFKYVILECSPFNYIDTVGVKLLIEIFLNLKKHGIILYLTECRFEVRHTFKQMKFEEKTDRNIVYVTTFDAVDAARKQIKKERKSNDGEILCETNQV